MGCDENQYTKKGLLLVSIHAPVWGATAKHGVFVPLGLFQSTHPCGVRHFAYLSMRSKVCFNPRTRVGCDEHITVVRSGSMFQSTHQCGVRQGLMTNKGDYHGFNPRTRVGCDYSKSIGCAIDEFQSTHPCGVRLIVVDLYNLKIVSIHAPVWGATQQQTRQYQLIEFQSTHPCGVRRSSQNR